MPRPYSDFINVNKEFVPVFSIYADRQYPNHWKTFYPHSTFINILGDLISSLEGTSAEKRASLWISGAYGTGKSFASFVIKHILEEDAKSVKSYFEKYKISPTLLSRLEGVKSKGDILVVHRSSSSDIVGSNRLFTAIQESVKQALKDKGYTKFGGRTLYDNVLDILKDPDSTFNFVNAFNKYKNKFLEYPSAESVVEGLEKLGPDESLDLLDRIIEVADLSGVNLARSANDVVMWIKEIIELNNLYAIVFIWDEFTQFFYNNQKAVDCLQEIAHSSSNIPFYFFLITHKTHSQFIHDTDTRKVLEARFKMSKIEMANTTAFMLMRQTLDFVPDLKADWDNISSNLWINVKKSVENTIKKYSDDINDEDLKGLLPLHPFAAFLLQWISESVNSNQRTMFQFLCSDPNASGTEKHNFRWFIQNHDINKWPYLTCDYIWDYFFELNNDNLDDKAKNAIIHYNTYYKQCENENEERVLKVVLLLTAIQQEKGRGVSNLLRPTLYNISAAFAGTPIADDIQRIMQRFSAKGIVGSIPEGNDVLYIAQSQIIDPDKERVLESQMSAEHSFEKLIDNPEYDLAGNFTLSGYAAQRFEVKCCTYRNLKSRMNELNNLDTNKIPLIFLFSKTEEDTAKNQQAIETAIAEQERDFIFVDISSQPLSELEYRNFITCKVRSAYFLKVNINEAKLNEEQAKNIIKNWKIRINNTIITLYSKVSDPISISGIGQFSNRINELDSKIYRYGLETLTSNDRFFSPTGYSPRVPMMGMDQEPIVASFNYLAQFKNNMAADNIWNNAGYYKTVPSHALSRMKQAVEKCIAENFEAKSSVCIADIWSVLKDKPFGLMECTGTAFVMGFLLKEYANSGYYRKDGNKNNVPLTHDNLADMIYGIIKGLKNADSLSIVKMTEEHKQFCKYSGEIFKLSADKQNSIQDVMMGIREVLPNMDFPLWALKYYIEQNDKYGIKDQVLPIIDLYCEFVSYTKENGRDETKVAEDIVRAINKDAVIKDYLREIFSSQNLKIGMDLYITQNNKDLPQLAERLSIGKGYISEVKARLTEYSAWLWDKGEIDKRIDEVYNDYKIIEAINKILPQPVNNFSDAAVSIKNRLSAIKMPYEFFRPNINRLEPLLLELIKIYKTVDFKEVNKQILYKELVEHADEFKSFYNNQQKIFREKVEILVGDNLDNDELEFLYTHSETGVLLKPLEDFETTIKQLLTQYQTNKKYNLLVTRWRERTGTQSPVHWSKEHMIPILCLFTDCLSEAKEVFDIINDGRAFVSDSKIAMAMSFIENNKCMALLGDILKCREIYKKYIAGDYDLLINDIEEVQDLIVSKLGTNVYEWFINKSVIDEIVKEYGNKKYKESYYHEVFSKIDCLPAEQAKEYLKELIKNEPLVGIKIMKAEAG